MNVFSVCMLLVGLEFRVHPFAWSSVRRPSCASPSPIDGHPVRTPRGDLGSGSLGITKVPYFHVLEEVSVV